MNSCQITDFISDAIRKGCYNYQLKERSRMSMKRLFKFDLVILGNVLSFSYKRFEEKCSALAFYMNRMTAHPNKGGVNYE